MDKQDLTQLAIKAKAGDRDAFGQLYEATFDLIHKYFVFRVHRPDDASDLTSQVYLEAWQNLKRFDTNRSFSAWIFGFAKFRLIDYYRAHRNEAPLTAVTDRADSTDIEVETATNLENLRVRASLDKLSEPYRTIIQLKYLQELEYPEMAKILGKTESHVRVMVKRGLDKLRNSINQL